MYSFTIWLAEAQAYDDLKKYEKLYETAIAQWHRANQIVKEYMNQNED
jgi:hypothetical protein